MRNEKEISTTKLWEDYQNGLSYQASLGLSKDVPQFVRFFEGKQWPRATENTKNLPRPVFNIIKMICRSKTSAILSTPVRLVYEAENSSVNTKKFNHFAAYIQKEMGQDAADKEGVTDGVKKGTYFYHYYWDSEANGKDGIREGALRVEVIDVLNMFFANPTERDEQKQKWILIVSREEVNSLRAKCDKDIDKDDIIPDEHEDSYGTPEQEGDKLCTVLTRYFRRGGEVYFEKATKSVVINKPRALAPDIKKVKKALGFSDEYEDSPNNGLPDGDEGENLQQGKAKAPLYPVVVGNYEKREKSIYGIGEVEGLIPNQKAINFNIAMSLLNAQEVAWGKYVVLPGALKGQRITNEPGQVLTNYSGQSDGIKKMTEQPLHGEPQKLAESIMQLTRSVTGASEIMTGEVISSNMSGAAIAQLQAQATQPIEELKNAFWLVKIKQGKVLAQFFKLYYSGKEFTYKESLPKQGQGGITKEVSVTEVFNGLEFADVDFDVTVEAVSGTKSSAAGDINALDNLLATGKITLKTYLKAYPDDALSNKRELLELIEAEEQNQLTQLTTELEQMRGQIAEYERLVASQQKAVDGVTALMDENTRLKERMAKIYLEAKSKIEAANLQIEQGNAKIAETTADATKLAQYVAAGMGGAPGAL